MVNPGKALSSAAQQSNKVVEPEPELVVVEFELGTEGARRVKGSVGTARSGGREG